MPRLTELEGVKRYDAIMVDPRVIRIEEGFNVRDFSTPDNMAHVETLAQSIAEVGVLNPLVIRYDDDQVWLVDGESRLRATLLAIQRGASIDKIQAVQQVVKADEAHRVATLITRNSGKPLSPLEQSVVIGRLAAFGWDEEEMAKQTNLSPAYVTVLLKLNSAPVKIKKMVSEGKVSASLAVSQLRDHGETKAVEVLSNALNHASSTGRDHATMKDVKNSGGAKEKIQRNVPLYYQRGQMNNLITQLVDIATNTEMPTSLRRKVKNALENADVDWKTWGQNLV
jgi:ParB/RepB/Spo0J family partition protein